MRCYYHWDRKKVEVEHYKVIDGTPMCERCYRGFPITEESLKKGGRVYGRRNRGDYDSEYYEANKEKIIAYRKEYYLKNRARIRERMKAYNRQFYSRYKEAKQEYDKEYYKKRKEAQANRGAELAGDPLARIGI